MLAKFMKKKTYTEDDLLENILNPIFDKSTMDAILKNGFDINKINNNKETYLHLCSKKGLIESIKWLLKNKAALDLVNDEGETALFYSLHSNKKSILELLIVAGADINHLNIHKRTLLQEAVISGNNKLIDFIIENSKNLNNIDIHGNNLIYDAVANGNSQIISKVANLPEVDVNQVNNEQQTVINNPTNLDRKDLILSLMELGVDPTILDKEGKNFLFHALLKGFENVEIFDKAVSLGCNLNSTSSNGNTLVFEAVEIFSNISDENKEERENIFLMIERLIKQGLDIKVKNNKGESVFFEVIRSKDIKLIELFLKNENTNPNELNKNNETILFELINCGLKNLNIIKLLLKYQLDPNMLNIDNKSAIELLIDIVLHIQSEKQISQKIVDNIDTNGEYLTVLREIVTNSKADLTQLNSKGKPIFFEAILLSNYSLFKVLKDYGLKISQKDNKGRNILFYIMDHSSDESIKDRTLYLEILQNLLNLGVSIKEKDILGETPLHRAVTEKCEYTVKLFLDAKPDFFAIDKKGRTVIHNCIWKDTTRYFKLIHSYNKELVNIADTYGIRAINYAAFIGKIDLVVEMLDAGALINNNENKDPKMVEVLLNSKQNILNILKDAKSKNDKSKLSLLATNMIREFNITEK